MKNVGRQEATARSRALVPPNWLCTRARYHPSSIVHHPHTTYTAGYCCSIFALIDDAISCSVANAAIASCAAMIANSCIAPGIVLAFTTGLAVVDMATHGPFYLPLDDRRHTTHDRFCFSVFLERPRSSPPARRSLSTLCRALLGLTLELPSQVPTPNPPSSNLERY